MSSLQNTMNPGSTRMSHSASALFELLLLLLIRTKVHLNQLQLQCMIALIELSGSGRSLISHRSRIQIFKDCHIQVAESAAASLRAALPTSACSKTHRWHFGIGIAPRQPCISMSSSAMSTDSDTWWSTKSLAPQNGECRGEFQWARDTMGRSRMAPTQPRCPAARRRGRPAGRSMWCRMVAR